MEDISATRPGTTTNKRAEKGAIKVSIKKFIDDFRKLPAPVLFSHVMSEFIGGIGIGVLLVAYLEGLGWWIILLSFIVGIPSVFCIFRPKDLLPGKSGSNMFGKGGGGEGKPGMNLYVGNLSREVDEQQLRKAFEPFGEIASVKIIRDRESGNSRGFGFIMMPVEAEARTAMKSMNGRDLNGRKLNVNIAIPRGGGKRRGKR